MADHCIKLRELRKILARYGVACDDSRGKGSHVMFSKSFPDGTFSYPVPTHDKEVKVCYVQGCRKKFRLRISDGIPDAEFYGGK